MRVMTNTERITALILHLTISVSAHFQYSTSYDGLEIRLNNRVVMIHTCNNPALETGEADSTTYAHDLGNFKISESEVRRVSLTEFAVDDSSANSTSFTVRFTSKTHKDEVHLEFTTCGELASLCEGYERSDADINVVRVVHSALPNNNRLWIRFFADPEEHLYGGGEQFSDFNLRGKSYPMWTREQGVGRDHSTLVTFLAEKIAGAGGDYHTTYWPQATFVSDRLFFAHLHHPYYSVLNFQSRRYHELELWEDFNDAKIYLDTAPTWQGLVGKLTSFLGRQPSPPQWIHNGAVVGLQGGTSTVLEKYESLKSTGVEIGAIWIQDWSGKIMTSLGKRVLWNWRWNPEMYPDLIDVMKRFKEDENVRFLSYINPHIIKDSDLYREAEEMGYFIKSSKTGATHVVDFGEMECASVDLTNPAAYEWYKQVLKEMLELGFSGWMADFGGEYLPVDELAYFDGTSPAAMHNLYSELWARLNKEAVVEAGRLDDTFIFMRSGWGRSSGHTLMSWAGDQNVDFSRGDGLASTIPAALSLGMSGMGMHHSDIGGYVSLICMVRTEELILRWAEMSAFTPVLRTHEGNRPDRNWQVYTSNETARSFARLSRMYKQLSPYHRHVAGENAMRGIPAQRPLFLHYAHDERAYDVAYQYMYGRDLIVAPVLHENVERWKVYLPPDDWVHMWSGERFQVPSSRMSSGIEVEVDAPVGHPPVFYRARSEWRNLFDDISTSYSKTGRETTEGLSVDLLLKQPLMFLYLLLRKLFWYVFFNVQPWDK